ncbi:MAG: Monosaccharide transporter substrate-binding protein family, partial [Pseudonocardiales bacterium]|nr:Monosaccharide transporter substrate-binding protein family [Pseudonocardiales bacterium]
MRATVVSAVVTVATVAVIASLAACGTTKKSGDQAGAKKGNAGNKTIAFLMPCSTCADRFESKDKPYFIQAVHDLDPTIKVIANNAQGSGDTQLQQSEAALTNGASVIVMSPMTEQAGASTVAKAAAVGAGVVAYDGMVGGGATPAYYVSFDNETVGKLQGQYLADHLKPGASVVLINGAPDSSPGQAFKKGAHDVLDPLFASGKLKKAYEADTPNFDGAAGQQEMEQALTALHDKVDAVLVANDGLANSVITALTARKLAGKVLVTGQDATDPGLQRILEGTQSMTVYKSIQDEAKAAAQIAVDLVHQKPSDAAAVATGSVNNGTADIPSKLLTPMVVDAQNIATTVLKDGFTTKDKICVG